MFPRFLEGDKGFQRLALIRLKSKLIKADLLSPSCLRGRLELSRTFFMLKENVKATTWLAPPAQEESAPLCLGRVTLLKSEMYLFMSVYPGGRTAPTSLSRLSDVTSKTFPLSERCSTRSTLRRQQRSSINMVFLYVYVFFFWCILSFAEAR